MHAYHGADEAHRHAVSLFAASPLLCVLELVAMFEGYRTLIEIDVATDTRELDSTGAFLEVLYRPEGEPPLATTLKGFANQRRAYLSSHPEIVRVRGR